MNGTRRKPTKYSNPSRTNNNTSEDEKSETAPDASAKSEESQEPQTTKEAAFFDPLTG